MYWKIPFVFTTLIIVIFAIPQDEDDAYMHPSSESFTRTDFRLNPSETYSDYWYTQAREVITSKVNTPINTNIAKNVIMFLGDGLSIPTHKAARIYNGQLEGINGEGSLLNFEKFEFSGLSKTYCLNYQVPDSACTATAYLCGVKAIQGTLGVNGRVNRGDCAASLNESTHVDSIASWSQSVGKRTGIVTTTRVTHASPAGAYAHSANRDWESSASNVPADCTDIAYQLVHGKTGSKFNVIFGGGRRELLPNTVVDDEGKYGARTDGINLIDEWLESKEGESAQYIWNKNALLDLPAETDYVLGLFESDHCQYNLEANKETEPSLEEMTEAAIKLLSQGENGYFLFVEGGRIDHAHHDTRAVKALDETIEFSKAIGRARDITSREDTLIVVTADHSHVMTVNGYADKDNNIFGMGGSGSDNIPYTTLSYANGPGYREDVDGVRYNPTQDDTSDKNYRFPALVPLDSETHGGDDVGIFASGPWAHLLTGVLEQSMIPHAMAYASCVGNGASVCNEDTLLS